MSDTNSLVSDASPRPDAETERAMRSFLRRVAERYPVREAILFGSRARHTHRPDSDADVAVILDGAHGNRTAAALDMAGIAFNVMMETGVMVEALPLWADDFEHPGAFGNPRLLQRIRNEGVPL